MLIFMRYITQTRQLLLPFDILQIEQTNKQTKNRMRTALQSCTEIIHFIGLDLWFHQMKNEKQKHYSTVVTIYLNIEFSVK